MATTNEREKYTGELAELLKPAIKRHLTIKESFVPGFLAIEIDGPVDFPMWGKQLKANVYHTPATRTDPEEPQREDAGWMYAIQMKLTEELEKVLRAERSETDGTGEDGEVLVHEDHGDAPIDLKFNLIRIDVPTGRPLQFHELCGWIAIRDADEAGETEKADRIFELLYGESRSNVFGTSTTDTEHEPYRRKRTRNVKSGGSIALLTDPLTNALMGRNENHIGPDSYFTESAVKVPTGGTGFALLDVRADPNTDIDAVYRMYQLNDRDRFWLDALYTVAIDQGKTSITGCEILQARNYSNPWAANSAQTMAEAASSISKAASTLIAIDVTNEKRSKRKGHAVLVNSTRLQPIVNAKSIDLDEYEVKDESGQVSKIVHDFTVNLVSSDIETALPLAHYARSRGMFTSASAQDFTFKGIGRLTTEDRQMWSYILRTVRSPRLSETIKFETMWRNLELDERSADAERKRRDRMVKKLGKMLDQKSGTCFKSWEWHKDPAGVVDGVKITRFATSKKN